MTRVRLALDIVVVVGLFLVCERLYRNSTGMIQLCDSAYSLVLAEHLLAHQSFDLSDTLPADPTARRSMPGYSVADDLPVHYVRRGDPVAVYYGYPLGSTILTLPFVANYRAKGNTLLTSGGPPDSIAEGLLQQRVASKLAAAAVALFYVVARFVCPPAAAFLIAAGVAVGSPVWSTLSRALWSHTWAVFLLTAVIALLFAGRRVRVPTARTDWLLGSGLGTFLFWLVFVRPQTVLSAAAVGVYLLVHHRRLLMPTVVVGLAWSAGLIAGSIAAFGTLTPPSVYQPGTIDGKDVLSRFGWLMASPSRGLLVYCPYLLVVGYLLIGYRRHLPDAALLLPAGLAVAAQTALFSCYNGWHAGCSFGPRYFCDVIPWFVLATAVGVGGMLSAGGWGWRKFVEVGVLASCLGWSIFVHYRGANVVQAWEWNYMAFRSTEESIVKDWQHPQFLAGITYQVKHDGSVVEGR